MTEIKTKLNIPLAAVVIGLCIPMQIFFEDSVGLTVGGFTFEVKYLFAAAIVAIGLFYVLIKADDLPFAGRAAGDTAMLFLPVFAAILISIVVWVLNVSDFRQITRGMSQTVYKLLGMLVALSLVVMFKEKAVFVHLSSMVITYGIFCLQIWLKEFSLPQLPGDYIQLITSFASDTPMSMMRVEYHDMCFGFGAYMTYFLICRKPAKQKIIGFLIAAFAFSFGLKRIVIPALIVAVIFYLIGSKVPEDAKKTLIRFFGVIMIALAFGYLLLIYNGLFDVVTEYLHINTMRRDEIYELFSSYYRISPGFLGYGLGFVERLIQTFPTWLYIGALHNDFLKMYIELGFWGYIIWIVLNYLTLPSFFVNKRNSYSALIYIAITAYCMATYMTDNTYVYFIMNLAAATSILSCSCFKKAEENTEISKDGENPR